MVRVGWLGGELYSQIVEPPLVSLVLINWNYAKYIAAAIESIRGQDYPSLEVVIVDNGSTDESRDVIAKHVEADSRFRSVMLDENLGQLGAFFDVFPLLNGEFVTIVDADDVLFSNFLSSHVQVHLALPGSVALTSSNVVEMTSDARALTGVHTSFGENRAEPITRGLRPADAALRLSTISDGDYLQLARSTSTHISWDGWIWGPGTSNMYRRSILALVHQRLKDRNYFRAADSYLNPLCHVFGGSALIDRHLSAYRVHGANYFAARESLLKLRPGRPEFWSHRAKEEDRELIRFLFQRASYFQEIMTGRRFWHIVDQLSVKLCQKGKFLADPRSLELFIHNYEVLRQAFGEADLLANLGRRMVPKDVRAVIREAHGGRIPPRVRLALLWGEGKAVRDAMEKSVKRAVKKTKKIIAGKRAGVKRAKKIVAGKRPTALEKQQQQQKKKKKKNAFRD